MPFISLAFVFKQVTVNANVPPAIGADRYGNTVIFGSCDSLEKIHVPADSPEDYKQADGWKDHFALLSALPGKPAEPSAPSAPDVSYDWNGVLTSIRSLGGRGSMRIDVGSEESVPHFIWQEIYGKNITLTFVRGDVSYVVNGITLKNINFDPGNGHMLSEFTPAGRTGYLYCPPVHRTRAYAM